MVEQTKAGHVWRVSSWEILLEFLSVAYPANIRVPAITFITWSTVSEIRLSSLAAGSTRERTCGIGGSVIQLDGVVVKFLCWARRKVVCVLQS